MMDVVESKKKDRAALVAELEKAGAVFKGNKTKCPYHEDNRPSAGVFERKENKGWFFNCLGCDAQGDYWDILARNRGESVKAVLSEARAKTGTPKRGDNRHRTPNTPRPTPQAGQKPFGDLEGIYGGLRAKHGGKLEALHEYHHSTGEHNQYVIRWRNADGDKAIRPAVETAAGVEMRFSENRTPYRLPMLVDEKTVIVLEGELKADILAKYGFPTTTSAGGSKAANKTDWRPLAGKNIIIWPDYDAPGRQYADDVRQILEGLGCKIKTIDPARLDLIEKEDAADYVQQLENAGYSEAEIKENLTEVFKNKTTTTGPAAELDSYFSEIIAGRFCNIDTGHKVLDGLIQIMPESLNVVCGSPGASKTLMMLQWLAYLIEQKIRAACLMLERKRSFHLARALAQRAGIANLTQIKWVRANPDLTRQAKDEHRDFIDLIGRAIWTSPDKQMTQAEIIDWAQQRADTGHRLILIDPATLAGRTDEPYKADETFVQGLKAVADSAKAAIVLVLHPVKGQAVAPDLSSVSGGAVYQRAADTALWLLHHDSKKSNVLIADGYSATEEIEHNRTLIILKSRDGAGTNSRIAFDFSSDDLKLYESGLILKKKRKLDFED